MSPSTKEETQGVEKIKVSRRLFDLSKFEKVTVEGPEVDFKPVSSIQEAGLSESEVLAAVNSALRNKVVAEAESQVIKDGFVPASVVSGFVNSFRGMPWAKNIEDRAAQTARIHAFIKSKPAMIELLKETAVGVPATAEDEDEDEG